MKMLLHICCAPCSVAIAEQLLEEPGMVLEGYFFNPNIHPEEEYAKRKASVKAMAEDLQFSISFNDLNQLDFWRSELSQDKNSRCAYCYTSRLEETAKFAEQKGFDAFSTSLLISPYQNHELIAQLGKKIAADHHISFYYQDFRPLYRKGREKARAKNWYMQKYCGCFYSYNESDHPKKPIYFIESIL